MSRVAETGPSTTGCQSSIPDIFVSVVDGGTGLQTVNLTALENSGQQAANQYEPSVDSDGQHVLVSYTERSGTILNPECSHPTSTWPRTKSTAAGR